MIGSLFKPGEVVRLLAKFGIIIVACFLCYLSTQFTKHGIQKMITISVNNRIKELMFAGKYLPVMAPIPIKNPGDRI